MFSSGRHYKFNVFYGNRISAKDDEGMERPARQRYMFLFLIVGLSTLLYAPVLIDKKSSIIATLRALIIVGNQMPFIGEFEA